MHRIIKLARFFSNHPLTRNTPLSVWGRFLAWQIRSRLQEEVIVKWIGGQRLAVRNGMAGITGNIYTGLHEFADMMLLLHFLREGDLFLDIGANAGSYTVLASGICKAKTWAFEPDPENAQYLKRNIAINRLQELVNVFELALGAEDGKVKMTVGYGPTNRIAPEEDRHSQVVRQQRLDPLIGEHKPIMIKMDVEGYEEQVLLGAEKMLADRSLQVIELETVSELSKAMLSDHGFHGARYDPLSRQLCAASAVRSSANYTFVRDLGAVAARLADAAPVVIFGRTI